MRSLFLAAAVMAILFAVTQSRAAPAGSDQTAQVTGEHLTKVAQAGRTTRRGYRTRQDIALGRVFDPITRTWKDPNRVRDRREMELFRRQLVHYPTSVEPGTVIIDPDRHFLYLLLPDDQAIRYGVGVGREGYGWSGEVSIGQKKEWPVWTPPAEMIKREPWLAEYANGMPGGEDNPLGARALYLFDHGRDTLYRIHGTNEPWSIGKNVSSGCIRMLNDDVVDLYQRVDVGTPVIVLTQIGPLLGLSGK